MIRDADRFKEPMPEGWSMTRIQAINAVITVLNENRTQLVRLVADQVSACRENDFSPAVGELQRIIEELEFEKAVLVDQLTSAALGKDPLTPE